MTQSDTAVNFASSDAGVPRPGWAARVRGIALRELQALRTRNELLVCEVQGEYWIRPSSTGELVNRINANNLPSDLVAERFQVTSDGLIIPWGCRVPTGPLPTGPWTPIAQRFPVCLPEAGFPSSRVQTTRLKFVRSESVVESTILEIPFIRFREFTRNTSILRLNRWEFAVSQSGSALVRGTPLPTLAGQFYWEASGIITPAGWTWTPSLATEVLRRVLKLEPDESALFRAGSTSLKTSTDWERIPTDAFVQASRSNIQATFQDLSARSAAEVR